MRTLLCLLGLAFTTGSVAAQSLIPTIAEPTPTRIEREATQAPMFSAAPHSPPVASIVPREPEFRLTSLEQEVPLRNPISFDLLVGLPTGLRAQVELQDSQWMAEGFVGLVPLPGVGLGIRRQSTVLRGSGDGYYINPGVGAYLMYLPRFQFFGGRSEPSLAGLAYFDADFVWKHRFSSSVVADFGLKAGLAIGGAKNGVVGFPILSIIAGLHF